MREMASTYVTLLGCYCTVALLPTR